MVTAGIIAEYNPFHKGHRYHIEETRRRTGADYIIIVMSGDYVQRGEPAAVDKYLRTRMALSGGADVVLELPVIYATASAEYFASAGVILLHQLRCVDYLSFGSEWAKTEEMEILVKLLSEEPLFYRKKLKEELRKGKNFPVARMEAVKSSLSPEQHALWRILEEPNHILGLEYMKSLHRLGSPIRPLLIKRQGAGYHDENIGQMYPSASAIRRALRQRQEKEVDECLPTCSPNICREGIFRDAMGGMAGEFLSRWEEGDFVAWEDLMPFLDYTVLMEAEALRETFGFDAEMGDRFVKLHRAGMDFAELLSCLHTKRLTDAAWRRALLHLALHIYKEPFLTQAERIPVPYARVLGFSERAAPLLKRMRREAEIPLIQRPAKGRRLFAADSEAGKLYAADIRAAQLYEQIAAGKSGRSPVSEWTRQQIIWKAGVNHG